VLKVRAVHFQIRSLYGRLHMKSC